MVRYTWIYIILAAGVGVGVYLGLIAQVAKPKTTEVKNIENSHYVFDYKFGKSINTSCGLVYEYANETIKMQPSLLKRDDESVSIYTLGVLYYCEPNALKFHINSWLSWPSTLRSVISFVILDDGSPYPACSAAEVIESMNIKKSDIRFDLQVHRINEDISWNIGGARNLLMTIAPTEYVIFLDTDTFVSDTLASSLALLVSDHCGDMYWMMLLFPRVWAHDTTKKITPHPAVTLVSKTLYWRIGGCDEDFVGHYGNTDPHFKWRAVHTRGARIASGSMPTKLPPMFLYDSDLKIMETVERPKLDKDIGHNEVLMSKKRSESIPWSHDYLRFTWERSY